MWIKICGIRDEATAAGVAKLSPDAIGLNFFAGGLGASASPRRVAVDVARRIVRQLPPDIAAVGVFVNHTAEEAVDICRRCGIRTAQFHGDEPPSLLAEVQHRLERAGEAVRLIRAHRLISGENEHRDKETTPDRAPVATPGAGLMRRHAGIDALASYLDECRKLGVDLFACLIDAHVAGTYGGTGKTVRWDLLADGYRSDWPPLILAGGLKPENVAAAIRAVRPWGIDVSSGVESTAGVKDLGRVRDFIQEARLAAGQRPARDDLPPLNN